MVLMCHFLTGTDEHGLKIQRAAESKNIDPKALNSVIKLVKHLEIYLKH